MSKTKTLPYGRPYNPAQYAADRAERAEASKARARKLAIQTAVASGVIGAVVAMIATTAASH